VPIGLGLLSQMIEIKLGQAAAIVVASAQKQDSFHGAIMPEVAIWHLPAGSS
jgi:hypothetical protein